MLFTLQPNQIQFILMILLLISVKLPLSFLDFALDALLSQFHLLNLLIFLLAYLLGPLRISSIELPQEVLLGIV